MTLKDEQIISAQVIVKSAGGKSRDGSDITAATIEGYAPASDTVKTARRLFQEAGFEVGNFVGISFAISGKAALFEKFFRNKLTQTPQGGIEFVLPNGKSSQELPENKVTESLTKLVDAIAFTSPPEFGPVSFV